MNEQWAFWKGREVSFVCAVSMTPPVTSKRVIGYDVKRAFSNFREVSIVCVASIAPLLHLDFIAL